MDTINRMLQVCFSRLGYDESLQSRPADLSMGEQKLVSIARAIIHDPALLFMDDPLSNLDEEAGERVISVLQELKNQNTTMIIVTGSTDLAYQLADNLGVLNEGTLTAFGSYDETVSRCRDSSLASLQRLKNRGERAGRNNKPADRKAIDEIQD